jgi:hypothetical protein
MNIEHQQVPQYGTQNNEYSGKQLQDQQQNAPPAYDQGQSQSLPLQAGYYAEPKPDERGPTVVAHGQDQVGDAVPLTTLNRGSAPVICPVCHRRAMTATVHKSGGVTQYVLSQLHGLGQNDLRHMRISEWT